MRRIALLLGLPIVLTTQSAVAADSLPTLTIAAGTRSEQQLAPSKDEAGHATQTVKEFAAQVDRLWATYEQMTVDERAEFERKLGAVDFAKIKKSRDDIMAWRSAVAESRAHRQNVPIDQATMRYIHVAAQDNGVLATKQLRKAYLDAGGDAEVLRSEERYVSQFIPDFPQRSVAAILLAMYEQEKPEEIDPGASNQAGVMQAAFYKELDRAKLLSGPSPAPGQPKTTPEK